MAAAVADHRPAQTAPHEDQEGRRRRLDRAREEPRPARRGGRGSPRRGTASVPAVRRRGLAPAARPVLVGFAVETAGGEALVAYARRKLEDKRVDLVVANEAADSFGRDDNRVVLVTAAGAETLPTASKSALARAILDRVRGLL